MPNRTQRRANPARYPKTLDEWDHDRVLKGVEIPSAQGGRPFSVDYELPNLNAFAKLGDIPNPVAAMAVRADWDEKFSPLTATGDERTDYFDLMCWVIAAQLRKPNAVEMAGSLEKAAEWVSHWTVIQQMVLWMRSQHMVPAEDIVAAAELAEKEAKGSDLASVTDLERFPDGTGGAPDVPGGAETGEGGL